MQVPVTVQHTRVATRKILLALLTVAILAALTALGFFLHAKFSKHVDPSLSGYQAVFLTNGQVYFGKLSSVNSSYVALTDIFYLQVNNPAAPAQQPAPASAVQQNPDLSLVKLGNELYGPQDEMYINRDQVLFYENMEANGKVAQEIAAYKASHQ